MKLLQNKFPDIKTWRVPLSGGATIKGDVYFGDAELEVKNRESIGDWIWKTLEPSDGLVLKKNNKPYLLVVNLEDLIKCHT